MAKFNIIYDTPDRPRKHVWYIGVYGSWCEFCGVVKDHDSVQTFCSYRAKYRHDAKIP